MVREPREHLRAGARWTGRESYTKGEYFTSTARKRERSEGWPLTGPGLILNPFREKGVLSHTLVNQFLRTIDRVNASASSMTEPWYYVDDATNAQQGPCTVPELGNLFAASSIGDSTLVWQEGQAGWETLASVSHLHEQVMAAKEPVTRAASQL